MITASNNEMLIRSLYDAANRHDYSRFAGYFSEQGFFNDISSGLQYRGKKELISMLEGWAKTFPDMKIQIQNVIGSGDLYCVEGTFVGTQKGVLEMPSGSIPATGKTVQVPLADVIQVRDGKIQAVSCYFAATVLMSQLGQMPVRKAA